MPQVAVEDLECFYEDDYFGAPWVEPEVVFMQHGMQGSSAYFSGWVPALAGKYRVLRRDLIGHGRTTAGRTDHDISLEGLAHDMVAFMDTLDLQSAHVVGHHTGGMAGVVLAALYPERVKSLCLDDCPIVCGEGLQKVMHGWLPPELQRKYEGWNDAIRGLGGFFAWRDAVRPGGQSQEDSPRQRWQREQLMMCDEGLLERYAQATREFNIDKYLASVQAPTLLWSLSRSGVTNLDDQFRMRLTIPNAQIAVAELGNPAGEEATSSEPAGAVRYRSWLKEVTLDQ